MDELEKLVAAQRAFQRTVNGGRVFPLSWRLSALDRLGEAIGDMEAEIIAALGKDLNKSPTEAFMTEIGTVKGELACIKKNLKGWMRSRRAKTPVGLFPAKCYQVPEPYGSVLIMSPWNYPFMLSITPLLGAIAAGNCAVIKPSAYAPATSHVIRTLIERCFQREYCAVV